MSLVYSITRSTAFILTSSSVLCRTIQFINPAYQICAYTAYLEPVVMSFKTTMCGMVSLHLHELDRQAWQEKLCCVTAGTR